MKIVHTIKDLQAELTALRAQGETVGLVPTMGALRGTCISGKAQRK